MSARSKPKWLLKPKNPFALRFDAEFFRLVPKNPGVYIMRSEEGQIIYIGKAKCLRDRLSSYRYAVLDPYVSRKTVRHLEKVRKIDWEILSTEKDAFARETELIHAHRPRFNVAMMRPELYLYVELHQKSDSHLKVRLTRNFKDLNFDENKIFGAFKGRKRLKRATVALRRLEWIAFSEEARSQRFLSFPSDLSHDLILDEVWIDWRIGQSEVSCEKRFSRLSAFFRGTSQSYLRELMSKIKTSENILSFWKRVAAEEFEVVSEFFILGPQRLKKLKQSLKRDSHVFSQGEIDKLLTSLV